MSNREFLHLARRAVPVATRQADEDASSPTPRKLRMRHVVLCAVGEEQPKRPEGASAQLLAKACRGDHALTISPRDRLPKAPLCTTNSRFYGSRERSSKRTGD